MNGKNSLSSLVEWDQDTSRPRKSDEDQARDLEARPGLTLRTGMQEHDSKRGPGLGTDFNSCLHFSDRKTCKDWQHQVFISFAQAALTYFGDGIHLGQPIHRAISQNVSTFKMCIQWLSNSKPGIYSMGMAGQMKPDVSTSIVDSWHHCWKRGKL